MTLDQLLSTFELAADGSVRILVNGHQRMSINAAGVSISDRDYPTAAFGNHGLYVDGRACIQVAPSVYPPTSKNLDRTGAFPDSAALSVQCTNIADQVAVNVWTGDRIADDGSDAIGVFVSTADANRSHSRNVGVRIDAVNYPIGARAAIDAREFGGNMPPVTLGYPGDGWVIDAKRAFDKIKPEFGYIFLSRALYDIGANTDHRQVADFQFYLDKHLAGARS